MVWKQISSLVNEFIPIGIAMKGLEKLNPKLKSFIGSATAAGYGANEIIKFLREKSNTEGAIDYKNQLEQREASGTERPDEAANLRKLNQAEVPGDILQGAGTLGAAALGGLGGAALAAISPVKQLSQKVGQAASPTTLQQGLATPVIAGRAIAQAQQAPHRLQAALKAKNAPQTALQASQSTQASLTPFDMLKQHSPEIGAFMQAEIKKGKDPIAAAASARKKPDLKEPITQLEAMAEQSFEDVIAQIFGKGSSGQQQAAPSEFIADQNKLADLIQSYIQSKRMR